MELTSNERLVQFDLIWRADAFSSAATVLTDAKEKRSVPEGYPEFWGDIEEIVTPLLEAEVYREIRYRLASAL